jgi:hypothetical protein
MPTTLLSADITQAHIKKLLIQLSDDDKSLAFAVEVTKPTGGAGVATAVTVPVTERQAEVLLRLARK